MVEKDRRSIIIRVFDARDNLINDLSGYRVVVRILNKPDGKEIYVATSEDKQSRVLLLEDGFIYCEVPVDLLELLRPYDLVVEIGNKDSIRMERHELKSFVKIKPDFNQNGYEQ